MEYWVQPALKWLHFERSPGNEVLIDVLLYDVYIELALGLIQLMPIALSDMWNIPCGSGECEFHVSFLLASFLPIKKPTKFVND